MHSDVISDLQRHTAADHSEHDLQRSSHAALPELFLLSGYRKT
jgi:hypothetical protein